MSYLEELNKYTESLNAQRGHYEGLLNEASAKYGEHAKEQFDQITEAMNMAGGSINALGMATHGLARAKQSIEKLAKDNGISTTTEGGNFGYWRNKSDVIYDPRGGSQTQTEQLTAMERRPMGVERTIQVDNKAYDPTAFDADGSSAQSAYDQARKNLLDPQLNDTSTTPRGTKLFGGDDNINTQAKLDELTLGELRMPSVDKLELLKTRIREILKT